MSSRLRWLVAAGALAAVAAGECSPERTPAATDPVREMRVGLIEYEIVLSHASAAPGPLALEITNAGAEAHDLRVEGTAMRAATPTIRPGETATLDVRVPEGQDELMHRPRALASTRAAPIPHIGSTTRSPGVE